MSTTTDQPAPATPAADVDATVEQLLRDANAGSVSPAAPAPAPAARPAPVAHRAASTDELPQELVGPGGVVIARREPETRAPEPAANGSHTSTAPKPIAPRPDELLNTMQADLAPTPAPAPPAPPPAAPPPATIEDLDAALAKKASVELSEDSADAPPLARAVAANPMPAAAAPAPPAAPPPAPILRPDAPLAAARSGAPPIAAATPAVAAQTPAPAPVVTEPKRSLLETVLGPIAMKADRLSPSARQTMLWAAFVTMISAAALWTIVLIRDPNAPPTEAPASKPAHAEASHAEPAPAAKHEEAKAKPKPASAKSGGHH